MRDIKFRAWYNKEARWLHGFDSSSKGCHILGETIIVGGWMSEVRLVDLNEVVVEQFTGLKDKNGVEIYEGDIMTSNTVVRWNNRGCCFEVTGRDFTATVDYASRCYEIIGNIHDNPELAKFLFSL